MGLPAVTRVTCFAQEQAIPLANLSSLAPSSSEKYPEGNSQVSGSIVGRPKTQAIKIAQAILSRRRAQGVERFAPSIYAAVRH